MLASSVEARNNTLSAAGDAPLAWLGPALHRLDGLLQRALKQFQSSLASNVILSFQGLFVTYEQVAELLEREPGQSQFHFLRQAEDVPENNANASPLGWLVDRFGLTGFDADVLLLALAPEIDLRYEKIFAYLQDDVTRKRPTVDLALGLLSATVGDKLRFRARFSSDAPLIRHRLIQLAHDMGQSEPSSLALLLKLDDQVRRLLLGQMGLDERLASFCRLIRPPTAWCSVCLDAGLKQALPRMANEARSAGKPLRLYFQGSAKQEMQEAVEALAAELGASLLSVRIDRIPESQNPDLVWSLVTREALLHRAVLFISDLDDFRGADASTRRRDLLNGIADYPGIEILAGRLAKEPQTIAPFGVIPVDFQIPDFRERFERWERELSKSGSSISTEEMELLAGRFRLSPLQISRAVVTAQLAAEWRGAQCGDPGEPDGAARRLSVLDLMAAARGQCGTELAGLASKIEVHYGWDDLVLPPDERTQLREICAHAKYRSTVYGTWGFDRKLSLGKGLNVLFSGPPGTGKTMGAEVIAHELGLDLYRIDLSQVVSKYIGETEKNLDRIFTAAEDSNAILFFDEADALFGKRSEVHDSHDRYANLEISYLLQKMEEYQGISFLATNFRQNIDDAFIRRLHAIVEFPFPDEEYRQRIWKGVFPKEAPLGDDVCFDLLAREVRLAGGNIRNMALAASFYAAADDGVIHLSHLVHAAYREHQKLARSWNPGQALKAAVTAQLKSSPNTAAHAAVLA